MLPTIAIVGRPNVGKSTLFNVLTRSRDALVADQAGLTRDRKFGLGKVGKRDYIVVDTGGLNDEEDTMSSRITQQALLAVEEADSILFLVDGRAGLTVVDEAIAQRLRSFNKTVHLVVNKTESLDKDIVQSEFYALGFQHIHPIAASHKQGIISLMDKMLSAFPKEKVETEEEQHGIKIAIVGRPNVGKSTLVNRMLGEERVIAFDQPGTTRDSVFIPFERQSQQYTLIDTAGVRRRSKVHETIERFSVIKTLQAIETAHVVVMIIDAREGMTDQDASLLGAVLDSGRALVVAVNKWDGLSNSDREQVRYSLDRKLHFIDFAKIHFISALHGTGVGNLFDSINIAYKAAYQDIGTAMLNHVLQEAMMAHAPPSVRGRRIKLRYMHQGGKNPPTFVIHGNQVDKLPDSYRRYLMNILRETFTLTGTPIRLELKQSDNPYKGKKNTLTLSQTRKRKRLMKHVKKKKK